MILGSRWPGQRQAVDREEEIGKLAERFQGFDVPNRRFMATQANTALLSQFGLPPRPDNGPPELLKVWDLGFHDEIDLLPFVFDADLVRNTQFRLFSREVDPPRTAPSRFENSVNWAAGYITANQSKRFMQIWGVWIVPEKLTPPANPAPEVPCLCSTWIGLDGQRRYFDASLPQIGTESRLDLKEGTVTAQAWIQWWARDGVNVGPVPLKDFPLKPGQRVLCVLTAHNDQTVVGVIVNLDHTPAKVAMAVKASPPVQSGNVLARPVISGATAEWVLERPRNLADTRLVNFPGFEPTRFEHCIAVEGQRLDIANLEHGTVQKLHGTRMVRMFDTLLDPARTAYMAMPRKLDDQTLEVTFGGFRERAPGAAAKRGNA